MSMHGISFTTIFFFAIFFGGIYGVAQLMVKKYAKDTAEGRILTSSQKTTLLLCIGALFSCILAGGLFAYAAVSDLDRAFNKLEQIGKGPINKDLFKDSEENDRKMDRYIEFSREQANRGR